MSMFVAQMKKQKSANLGGMHGHNERSFLSHSNPDIDSTKKDENYSTLENINQDKSYRERVDTRLEYLQNKKEELTGKKPRAIRKDAVLVNEFIISSDKEFFDKIPKDKQKEFFKSATDWFVNRYGEENILFATVHNDETTPHMHLGVMPIIETKHDIKLSGKVLFDRAELLAIQEDLPKLLKGKGFDIERGLKGSEAKHENVKDYKKNLEKEIKELEGKKKTLAKDVVTFKKPKTVLSNVQKNVRQSKLNSSEMILPKADYKKLNSLALSSIRERENFDDYAKKTDRLLKNKNELIADLKLENKGYKIIHDLNVGLKPKDEIQGKEWLKILDQNKAKKLIPVNRLEKAINTIKDFLQKLRDRYSVKNIRLKDKEIKQTKTKNKKIGKDHGMEL